MNAPPQLSSHLNAKGLAGLTEVRTFADSLVATNFSIISLERVLPVASKQLGALVSANCSE
jgi:hypothetical protein